VAWAIFPLRQNSEDRERFQVTMFTWLLGAE